MAGFFHLMTKGFGVDPRKNGAGELDKIKPDNVLYTQKDEQRYYPERYFIPDSGPEIVQGYKTETNNYVPKESEKEEELHFKKEKAPTKKEELNVKKKKVSTKKEEAKTRFNKQYNSYVQEKALTKKTASSVQDGLNIEDIYYVNSDDESDKSDESDESEDNSVVEYEPKELFSDYGKSGKIKYPHTSKTVEEFRWLITGQKKTFPYYRYGKCSQAAMGCKTQVRIYGNIQNKDSIKYVIFGKNFYHNHLPAPPVKSQVENHVSVLRNLKKPNQIRRDQISKGEVPNSIKQLENRNDYLKHKDLDPNVMKSIQKVLEVTKIGIKPFYVDIHNRDIELSLIDDVHVDTTFSLIEDELYFTTMLASYEGMGLPIAHCISAEKNGRTYESFFNRTRKQLPDLNPKRTYSDFDEAIQNALSNSFRCENLGDIFHFYQANRRWVQKKEKTIEPNQLQASLNRLVQASNWEEFETEFKSFKDEWLTHTKYLEYFDNQWMKKFPPKYWSKCCGNNPVDSPIESWHNFLQRTALQDERGTRLDSFVFKVVDNMRIQNKTFSDPTIAKQDIEHSKSLYLLSKLEEKSPKKKRVSVKDFGVETPKPKRSSKNDYQNSGLYVYVDGNKKPAPRYYPQISAAITYGFSVTIVYKDTASKNPNERQLNEIEWAPYPYLIRALEQGGTTKKTFKLNKMNFLNVPQAEKKKKKAKIQQKQALYEMAEKKMEEKNDYTLSKAEISEITSASSEKLVQNEAEEKVEEKVEESTRNEVSENEKIEDVAQNLLNIGSIPLPDNKRKFDFLDEECDEIGPFIKKKKKNESPKKEGRIRVKNNQMNDFAW